MLLNELVFNPIKIFPVKTELFRQNIIVKREENFPFQGRNRPFR
jgi:hypothetical protein